MKTGTIIVSEISTGNVTFRLPRATERTDGSIWATRNQNPLVMISHLSTCDELGKKYAEAMKQRKPELIKNEHIARIGEYGDKRIEWVESYNSRVKAAITPAQRERNEIGNLYCEAERIANSDSEDNVWLPMQLQGKADQKLKAWRETYPAEARKEKANGLRSKAARERDLASGAQSYDSDGWLSKEDQKKRHDDHLAKARGLEKQAAELEKG